MPVEIRELTIKVNINQGHTPPAIPPANLPQGSTVADREKLLQDTVEQVLKILGKKNEE